MVEDTLLHSDITHSIIGAAMEVHKILGAGFLENVYEESFACELGFRKINFQRQKTIDVIYKKIKVKQFCCDFIIEDTVLVELKAIKKISVIEQAQINNYLKATGLKIGLLINFGSISLEYKRFMN